MGTYQKCKKYNAQTPNIGRGAIVLITANDFGTGIVWWSARRLKHVSLWLKWSHSKICYFNVVSIVQQQIFRFQIPVTNIMLKLNKRCYPFLNLPCGRSQRPKQFAWKIFALREVWDDLFEPSSRITPHRKHAPKWGTNFSYSRRHQSAWVRDCAPVIS